MPSTAINKQPVHPDNSLVDKFKDAVGAIAGLLGGSGLVRCEDTVVEAIMKSAARTIGSTVGHKIIRRARFRTYKAVSRLRLAY